MDRQLLTLLDEFPGVTVEQGSKHWKLKMPDGRLVGVWPYSGAGSQYSRRGTANVRAQLRRAHR
jgi:hypothetical protein